MAMPHPAEDAADLLEADFREGVLLGPRLFSPWHAWLDEAKFAEHLNRVQSLDIRATASAHGPAIYGRMVDEAFALLREIPRLEPWQEPTQAEFTAMLAAVTGSAERGE